ncbi:MAG: 3-hydroxyacyl-CoA dehydrogenase NAD-binding domain-containing protein [Methylotetracoccus sp.]|nr:3-hydroxyacyl-CoA dehydrogenase NAD-binding domain-containing protein [Methylotetracoccus sp.]
MNSPSAADVRGQRADGGRQERLPPNIQRAAVIGAGVMGAGIAAHLANAGVPVQLLDIVPHDASDRNVIAETAIAKLLKAEPPALMRRSDAALITAGNVEDHLERLADVDWVVEAVIEDPAVKQAVFEKLDAVCRPDALISSNTSTLPLALLSRKMPEAFRRRFMITHFFNPPRYMRLLELVADPALQPELLKAIQQFADVRLGKTGVLCKDAPGFVANRIGTFWLQCGLLEAIELDLTVEEADAALSTPFGIPKTGIFGLYDLIGLELLPQVLAFLRRALPAADAFHRIDRIPPLIEKMIAAGQTGRKGKGGFYRWQREGERDFKESIDLHSGVYRRSEKPQLAVSPSATPEPVRAWLSGDDKTGRYAWRVMSRTLAYSAGLIPEIADDITVIDTTMRLGYNWTYGPFELLDRIGVEWFVGRLRAEGCEIPPLLQAGDPLYRIEAVQKLFRDPAGGYRPVRRPEGALSLADAKRQRPVLRENASASLWDIGNGVACLEFHSKMNALDMDTMTLIRQGIDLVGDRFCALVIYNEGTHFSAGANLSLLVQAIHAEDWDGIERMLCAGQTTYQALKYAPFPVVGAPSGLALGGGCEILLHCDAIQTHAELYAGLVETGVGLIPGWGGCKEYLRRQLEHKRRPGGPIPAMAKALETIGRATVSQSAFEAQERLFLARSDGITMNRDRVLADAKAKALSLCPNYAPPRPGAYALPGRTGWCAADLGIKTLRLVGKITAYDAEVARQLAYVLSGGGGDITHPLSEDDVLALEREAFHRLVRQPGTLQRLEHMLRTGKPLRN